MTNPISRNSRAFLDMIAHSEGTDIPGHPPGYDVIVGSTPRKRILIKDMSRHPNVAVQLTETLWSTAAGRYQIIYPTWSGLKWKLKLKDFGGKSQDACAIELIKQANALDLVNNGKFEAAVKACCHIWASLPGAGYGQHENKMSELLSVYKKSGGVVA